MIEKEEHYYKTHRAIFDVSVRLIFNPIVLHIENVPENGAVIIAPNHLDTLDPMCIMNRVKRPIHWAALKRFFDAQDSIFKNSKNPLLCRLTSIFFTKGGFIPIDRNGDNSESLDRMSRYLKHDGVIGIFPEGTTNKSPATIDVQKPHLSFARMAADSGAWIVPVTMTWLRKSKRIRHRAIVNYGMPYKITDERVDESAETEKWTASIRRGLAENNEYVLDCFGAEAVGIIRSGFSIKPSNGKRDTDILRHERDGFVRADGSVYKL